MNWLQSFWWHYEVPSLYGNGPEAVTELIVVGIVTALLVPPVRRFAARKVKDLKDHITGETAALHARLDRSHERQDELMRHLQHIIKHHPDLPPLPPKENE